MSGYNGRRGPNVSQYLAGLNSTLTPEEIQEPSPDFSMFLDQNLFEPYPESESLDFNPTLDLSLDNIETPAPAAQASRTLSTASATDAKMDFGLGGDFQFANFPDFSQPLPIDSSLQNPLPAGRSYSVGNAYTSSTDAVQSPIIPGFDAMAGKKRKAEAPGSPDQLPADDTVRHAADEDKRRRNTAASARFRVKKKQREQALEKTAKEMTERVGVLEARIQQLETENSWLKGLITEKNVGKTDPSELRERLSRREESERSNGNRTDGVGTKASGAKA